MSKFKLGDRVKFTYLGEEPFTGKEISGEVVLMNGSHRVGVYRDPKWRHADAVVTWVPEDELKAEICTPTP